MILPETPAKLFPLVLKNDKASNKFFKSIDQDTQTFLKHNFAYRIAEVEDRILFKTLRNLGAKNLQWSDFETAKAILYKKFRQHKDKVNKGEV